MATFSNLSSFTTVVPGTSRKLERTSKRYVELVRYLHAARVQYLGARCRVFQHLFIADEGQKPGLGDDIGVCGENAVNVRVDLARNFERGGKRGRGCV